MFLRHQARMASLLLLVLPLTFAFAEQNLTPRAIGTHAGGIASVDFSPDGKQLVSGGGDKVVRIWDVASGKSLHELKGPTSFTCAARFSPDGKTVAAAGYESAPGNAIYLFDVAKGVETARLPGHPTGGIRRLAFTPDGKLLLSGGFDGFVRVWDLDTHKEVRAIKIEAGTVYDLALSPDGKTLATAGRDGLRLWDVATGTEQVRKEMNLYGCIAVTFAPDGKIVACGDSECVKLWEVLTGKEIKTFTGFKGELAQLLFSRDGRTLFTSSYDRAVRMWEVQTGRLVQDVEAHTGWVWGIALCPDQKTLASCSVDTRLLCWDLQEFGKPAKPAAKLSDGQLEKQVKLLASPDAKSAYRAICALAGNPESSLPLLRQRLTETRAKEASIGDVEQLMRDLDSDTYAVREQATRALEEAGVRALPWLKHAITMPPSLEVKKRAIRLLARLDPMELPTDELIALRGVQTLEYMGTSEARALLEQLARSSEQRLRQEANQALTRLERR